MKTIQNVSGVLIVVAVIFFGCQFEQSKISLPEDRLDVNAPEKATESNDGKVPGNLSVFDIVLYPNDHTWKDLDEYYRKELPNHREFSYFRNLRSMLFYHLVSEFNLDNEADDQTVEFYVKEQIDHGVLAEPDLFVRCLKRLERDGNFKYLLLYASNKYRQDLLTISEHPALEVLRPKYNGLKAYVDELNVKFNVKMKE